MKRILLLLLAAAALPAFAGTDDMCWARDTERMDFYTNPPSRGDNAFFSYTVSGTSNVTMIYPGTASMRALPISLFELRTAVTTPFNGAIDKGKGYGCSNSFLNNLQYFMPSNVAAPAAPPGYLGTYNYQIGYPEPEYAYSGGGGVADNFEYNPPTSPGTGLGYNSLLTDGSCVGAGNSCGGYAWLYTQWPANDPGTQSSAGAFTPGGVDATCGAAVGATSGNDFNDCELCVRTYGYWLNYNKSNVDTSPQAFVAKGNWLNFFLPKWAMLHLSYKRLVNGPMLNPLREGIGTQNASAGWYRLQKMLPQSCSGAGRPNQRIYSTDSVTYNNTTNPLAEMLFNVAWTESSVDSSPPSTWGFFANQVTHPASEPGTSSDANKKAGFCPGCNAGFSVMFSDGRGHDGLYNCDLESNLISNPLYTLPQYCNGVDSHNTCAGATTTGSVGLGMGAENDGNDFLDPNQSNGAGPVLSSVGSPYYGSYAGVCANDWLPNVAAWMYATNFAGNGSTNIPGTNLRLYTVGIGDNFFGELNTLRSAASAGHGVFINASNFANLEKAINKIFLDILSNSTSFSVAAITTVQTRGTTFAFIPRFRPLPGAQWEGRLYRFRLFNEFAAGCGPKELTGGPDGGPLKDSLNPNGNASCTDLYLTDANNSFVGENDGGAFVLLDSSQPYTDAGWPLLSPITPAAPVWEAAHVLGCREAHYLSGSTASCDDGGTPIAPRNIYTLGMDSGVPPVGSALVSFNSFDASVPMMTDYMKLSGVNSQFCVGMASTTRHTYASEQDCGLDLMKFIDGQDVMRQNADGGPARPNILGDIFHSSPILVTPPAPTFLCETGIVSQCVRTLYAQDTSGGFTPNSQAAYATYFNNNAGRQEIILVGANDGMLHAFQAGTAHGDAGFDEGTGVELWAFIPPDLLPKLQRYALSESHNILLDGAPWVRDIWKDGSGSSAADEQKEFDEFHTIAVIGEREGGRRYTALDVTNTSAPPKFLWTWPPPGSNYDLAEGESWNDTTPNPPPIGPVLMADAAGPITVTVNGVAVKASERWVAVLSGGYDPNLVRGRAIYVVDAWDGTLLFKFSRYDTTSSADPRFNLGSVAAPVSMVDSNFDNFFDLAVVGDAEGQLWSIDMLNPGSIAGGLVNNWFGGLTFQQFKGSAISNRAPFFTMAGARVFDDSKGGVRVYLGGGDRDQIKVRDTDAIDGGTCVVDNLRGCIRNNCSVDVKQNIYAVGTGAAQEQLSGEWQYTAGGTSLSTNAFTLNPATGVAGACNDPAQVQVTYSASCPGGVAMLDPNDGGNPVYNTMYCDFDGGNDGGEECPDTSGKPTGANAAFVSPTIANTRFYSVKVFDAPAYSSRPRMINTSAQTTYNGNTLGEADLTDVSTGAAMSPDAGGWRLSQTNDQNEKTASSALLLGGCVAWNTEVPSNIYAADSGVCAGGSIPSDTAYTYQASDDTGIVQCGLPGSASALPDAGRYVARQVTVTPQQYTPVVSLNAATGQAAYTGVALEPGGNIPLQVSVGATSVQGDVSWLDVSRTLHNCRHVADGGTPVCTGY